MVKDIVRFDIEEGTYSHWGEQDGNETKCVLREVLVGEFGGH